MFSHMDREFFCKYYVVYMLHRFITYHGSVQHRSLAPALCGRRCDCGSADERCASDTPLAWRGRCTPTRSERPGGHCESVGWGEWVQRAGTRRKSAGVEGGGEIPAVGNRIVSWYRVKASVCNCTSISITGMVSILIVSGEDGKAKVSIM